MSTATQPPKQHTDILASRLERLANRFIVAGLHQVRIDVAPEDARLLLDAATALSKADERVPS